MSEIGTDTSVRQLIGGMVDSTDSETVPVIDPATATRVGTVPRGYLQK